LAYKLLGHLDKETLADYYANADVFVHPNPKEPFGIAPLEAMASGVATVAPKAGGILSYAADENAWLVEPTAQGFAAAIKQAVNDPELRARKIARAVQTARENTREASTDRLFATYDKIYEHFQSHKELFVDVDAAKDFDYVQEVLPDH
jgi:glycosyltransferase involved in cell wall biosynthesis